MQLIFYFLKLIKASFTRYRNQKSRNVRFGFSSVHNVVQLSNFFLKDLEKLREFAETYHKHKLLSLS